MDIGNTHIDGSLLVALTLVVGSALAIYMLRNRPKPPIEHPSTRALRLIKERQRVIPAGVTYFVPEDEDKVVRVDSMTARDRMSHPSGRLVRSKDGYIEMALIGKDQNTENVRDSHFWIAT
jgi:hypothetical protein